MNSPVIRRVEALIRAVLSKWRFPTFRWFLVSTLVLGGLTLLVLAMLARPTHADPATTTFVVNTTDDTVDANPGDSTCADSSGNCSLRAAVMEANALGGPVTIQLPAGTYTLTVGTGDSPNADSDDLDVTVELTIQGAGSDTTVIKRPDDNVGDPGCSITGSYQTGEFRLFHVHSGASLTLNNVQLANGCADGVNYPEDAGGAIFNQGGTVVLQSVVLRTNKAYQGGAIYNEGTLIVSQSTFSGNYTDGAGGAIFNAAGATADIDESTFERFSYGTEWWQVVGGSDDYGGAIYNEGQLTVTGSQFTDLVAYSGGAVYNDDNGTATITASVFQNLRTSSSDGGAIKNYGQMEVEDSQFLGNRASDDGGAIYSWGGSLEVRNSLFDDNSAGFEDDGGAISGRDILIEDSTIRNNSAPGGYGGGIEGYNITIVRSSITGNSAGEGGGIEAGNTVIINSTIAYNQADDDGGGIYSNGGLTIVFSTIAYNSAGGSGDGVDLAGDDWFKNSIVAENGNENCYGSGKAAGVNFDDDGTCPEFIEVTDVGLGALTDGVVPLDPSSPAVEAAVDCTDLEGNPVTEDQQGTSRPQGTYCDVGAYELTSPPTVNLSVSPSAVQDLGVMEWNTSASVTWTVANSGDTSVTLGSITAHSMGLDIVLTAGTTCINGLTLNPGDSCDVAAEVTVTRLHEQTAAVTVEVSGQASLYLLARATGDIHRTFVVNTTDDGWDANPGDGVCDYDDTTSGEQCSVRAAFHEATAWDGGHFTIILQTNTTYTLDRDTFFGAGLPVGRYRGPQPEVVVQGNGATIDAGVPDCQNDPKYAELIDFNGPATLELRDLTLQHACLEPAIGMGEGGQLVLVNVVVQDNNGGSGDAGGLFMQDDAQVYIEDSQFLRNKAENGGAIFINNGGTLTVVNSVFEGNSATNLGGAIGTSSPADVALTNVAFKGNSASLGGALHLERASATLNNVTIENNTADSEGGGIWAGYGASLVVRDSAIITNTAGTEGGGGIYIGSPATPSTLTMVNVTVSGNTTSGPGGGIDIGSLDHVRLSFVTIANNSGNPGGINNEGTADIKNSIVAQNSGNNCGGSGTVNTSGVNFADDGTCPGFTQSSNLNLGPLADNGGNTLTHALQPGSDAIDAATDCTDLEGNTVVADQRGEPRPQGFACDAGAYEMHVTTYTLTVTKAGTGSGTVTSDPPGIDCGGDCSEAYPDGTVVTLTATPAADSTFAGWEGCDSVSGNQCTVTVNADKTVTATFDVVTHTLTVAGAGTGSGTVTSDPAGIDCSISEGSTSGDCSETVTHGTTITLTATAAAGSTFAGWSGCDSVSGNRCTVTVDDDKTVTATFEQYRIYLPIITK